MNLKLSPPRNQQCAEHAHLASSKSQQIYIYIYIYIHTYIHVCGHADLHCMIYIDRNYLTHAWPLHRRVAYAGGGSLNHPEHFVSIIVLSQSWIHQDVKVLLIKCFTQQRPSLETRSLIVKMSSLFISASGCNPLPWIVSFL